MVLGCGNRQQRIEWKRKKEKEMQTGLMYGVIMERLSTSTMVLHESNMGNSLSFYRTDRKLPHLRAFAECQASLPRTNLVRGVEERWKANCQKMSMLLLANKVGSRVLGLGLGVF